MRKKASKKELAKKVAEILHDKSIPVEEYAKAIDEYAKAGGNVRGSLRLWYMREPSPALHECHLCHGENIIIENEYHSSIDDYGVKVGCRDCQLFISFPFHQANLGNKYRKGTMMREVKLAENFAVPLWNKKLTRNEIRVRQQGRMFCYGCFDRQWIDVEKMLFENNGHCYLCDATFFGEDIIEKVREDWRNGTFYNKG